MRDSNKDISKTSQAEGSLRENTVFVNAAKPGWCRGMMCHFSARDDPWGKAVTKGMGKKLAFGMATIVKVREKDAAVAKAQVIKV